MYYSYLDWTIILVLPGLLLGIIAQAAVSGAFSKYSRVNAHGGETASDVARMMLNQSQCGNVGIREINGRLNDHYDPKSDMLSLSGEVYGARSVAAIGVAAHECGHAMQQHDGYWPLKLRVAVVPVVNFGSKLYFPLFILGFLFSWQPLVYVGIGCFALTLLFALITLPVEFNASRRAIAALRSGAYLTEDELRGAKAVLNAAALTYVAAAVTSLLQLMRLILIARRRSD